MSAGEVGRFGVQVRLRLRLRLFLFLFLFLFFFLFASVGLLATLRCGRDVLFRPWSEPRCLSLSRPLDQILEPRGFSLLALCNVSCGGAQRCARGLA